MVRFGSGEISGKKTAILLKLKRQQVMWREKFSGQLLRVLTPLGPRYIKPSSTERLYLLWMFRHFPSLPEPVLTPRQKKLIERLCNKGDFAFVPDANRLQDIPLIGTVERASKYQNQF